MKSGELFEVVSAGILIGATAWRVIPVHNFLGDDQEETGLDLNISASVAIKTVANDSIV